MSDGKIAVVAGATGYLGRFVVKAFSEAGFRVRALVRDEGRLGWARQYCDEIFVGHATRPETIRGLFDGADMAFSSIGIRHFRRRPTYWEVDWGANHNLVEEARAASVRRFGFVSVLRGDEMRRWLGVAEARERVVDEILASPMEGIIIRPTGFFNDMAEIFGMARRGRVWLIGDGSTKVNPIHGEDLASFIVETMVSGSADSQHDVGGPEILSQRQIAELAFEVLGSRPSISSVPASLLDWAGRIVHPFNNNAGAFMRMFASLGSSDAVAPQYGTHTLREFFQELKEGSSR